MFNDLNAPRFNDRKYRENIVSNDLYKRWKENNKTSKLSFIEFRNICWAINTEITDVITEEPDGVRLPMGMGDIYIGYVPRALKAIDYKASREYGKPIYHENWNSSGKLAKIIFGTNTRHYIFKRAWMWGFEACRPFARRVVQCLKDNPQIYKNTIEKRSLNKYI